MADNIYDPGAWYLRKRGQIFGPYSAQQLKQLRDRGQVTRFHELSRDKSDWQTADRIGLFAPEPAPQQPEVSLDVEPVIVNQVTQQVKYCHACGSQLHIEAEICPHCGVRSSAGTSYRTGASDKKILPAFLFAFFFGLLGIHRFYVGKIGSGIAMLVLTFTFFGILVSAVWATIDWIMIMSGSFTDEEGRKLTVWT